MSYFLLDLLLVISSCLPLCTQAHMQMSWPYPFRSPLDPAVPESEKDYSMTSPLLPDGSDFSCKHYQNDTDGYVTKASYTAGNTYNITLAGSATHMGGSCQISLSYDNGSTFKVIKSIVGGCPLKLTYDFTIPNYAPPSGSALLSWSWFNIVGNREMYQNCARVDIQRAPNGRHRRTTYKRQQQSSVDDLPDMFVCNVGNGCTTIEREEVVFPNPGGDVEYGEDLIAPDPGPGYTLAATASGSAFSTVTAPPSTITPPYANYTTWPIYTGTITGCLASPVSTSTPIPSSTPVATTSSQTYTSSIPVSSSTTSSTGTTTVPSTMVTSTLSSASSSSSSTSSSASPNATSLPDVCTPGTFACSSNTTFSQCVSTGAGTTSYIYMGSVAAGMQCIDGSFTRQNDGPCTPNGSIFCDGTDAFYLCDEGGLVNMGSVAAGTRCENGQILAV